MSALQGARENEKIAILFEQSTYLAKSGAAATVFPRPGPQWLIFASKTVEAHERTTLR